MYNKTCIVCGKVFETNVANKKMCCSPHPKRCEQCGKEFTVTIGNRDKRFCSLECSGKYRIEHGISKEVADKAKKTRLERYGSTASIVSKEPRTCILCGNEFIPVSNHQMVCKSDHYVPCCVCGKPVKLLNVSRRKEPVTCSMECENIKRSMSLKKTRRLHGTEILEKTKKTNLERYGALWPQQSEEKKQKYRVTMQERYGVDSNLQLESCREKIRETNLNRYGVENPMQSEDVKKRWSDNYERKTGYRSTYSNPDVRVKIQETCIDRYGVPYACMTEQCINSNPKKISNINIDFSKRLGHIGIETEFEFPIENRSYDLHILNSNILIEIDPTVTHNSYYDFIRNTIIDTPNIYYQLNKTKLAESNGYRCVHIWDWDDKKKILQLLKPKDTIYARKCRLERVDNITVNEFLNIYHLQNTCRGQKHCYGLYYKGTLVGLMTFGKPRYNKNYEWELLRLCFHPDYKIVGGSERLFKAFIREVDPESIVSYCDRSKFSGNVYYKLGMKLKSKGSPAKHWYSCKKEKMPHITDNLLRQRGYDQLFDEHYGKGTSNEELILARGYLPVYDCGQMTFTWNKEQ